MSYPTEPPPSYESVVKRDHDVSHAYEVPLQGQRQSTNLGTYIDLCDDNYYVTVSENGATSNRPPPYNLNTVQDNRQITAPGSVSRQATPPQSDNTPVTKCKWCTLVICGLVLCIIISGAIISLRLVNKDSKEELDKPTTTTEPSSTAISTTTTEVSLIDHRDCSTNPCIHGTCTEAGAGPFLCICDEKHYGERCENLHMAIICDIQENILEIGRPTYRTTSGYDTKNCYVCPEENCENEVHMIAMYEPEGSVRGFRQDPIIIPEVPVNIVNSSNHKPLTLVLSTYEAIDWIVNVPNGVILERVILMSYYITFSSVIVKRNGIPVTNFDLHVGESRSYMDHRGTGAPPVYSFGYGCSSCKGVDEVHNTITSQYGCFTSFSGRYEAASWTLNLDPESCSSP